jgi:tRNA1Val (adenine37-N6)-methyltransferase
MSNSYFQFKTFIVHQEHCAMKVCTDACLFGAWVGDQLQSKKSKVNTILDIGTGTGLLGLMLAQKTEAVIDLIEIDNAAAQQAADNVETSPWKNRVQVIQGDIRYMHLGRKYDCIISNPPFFENSLKSPDGQRNLALHSDMLRLDELIAIAHTHLSDDGSIALLLPYERGDECIKTARTNGLYLYQRANVRQSSKHDYFRSMLLFTIENNTPVTREISIRENSNYSFEFVSLLRDYYLHL